MTTNWLPDQVFPYESAEVDFWGDTYLSKTEALFTNQVTVGPNAVLPESVLNSALTRAIDEKIPIKKNRTLGEFEFKTSGFVPRNTVYFMDLSPKDGGLQFSTRAPQLCNKPCGSSTYWYCQRPAGHTDSHVSAKESSSVTWENMDNDGGCGDVSTPYGTVCNRGKGHDGAHAAHSKDGFFLASWGRKTKKIETVDVKPSDGLCEKQDSRGIRCVHDNGHKGYCHTPLGHGFNGPELENKPFKVAAFGITLELPSQEEIRKSRWSRQVKEYDKEAVKRGVRCGRISGVGENVAWETTYTPLDERIKEAKERK